MEIAYLYFLYLPVYINVKAGYMGLDFVLQRMAAEWDFSYIATLASGYGYGDPLELGVLIAERSKMSDAVDMVDKVLGWLPVPYEELSPADALVQVQVWGAPGAYLDGDRIVKP